MVRKSTIVIYTLLAAFWLAGCLPFLLQEVTHDQCESINLLARGLCSLLMMPLGIWTLRHRTDVAIIVVTILLTYYSTCIVNSESIFVWANGLRRYVPYMFVLPIIRYLFEAPERRKRFVRIFDKHLYIFLWIQFPCLTLQAIVWGIGDNGGGTLGWLFSGLISQIIYLVSFYLMVRRWNPQRDYFGNLRDNWVLLVLLFPSFLNETKISFILLMLYFLFLLPFDRYLMRRLLVVVPALLVLMSGSLWFYLSTVDRTGRILDPEFFSNYVLGSNMIDWAFELLDSDVDADDVWEMDYARGIKFALLPTLLERGNENNEMWGYGVGQFKGGNGMEKTDFAKRYEWMLRGTQTEMFNNVVELGYTGGVLLLIFWGVVFRFFKRVGKENRNRRMQWWMGFNMLLMIFYSAAFDIQPFVLISLYMCFVSSRWSQMPAHEKSYMIFPDKSEKRQSSCQLLSQ